MDLSAAVSASADQLTGTNSSSNTLLNSVITGRGAAVLDTLVKSSDDISADPYFYQPAVDQGVRQQIDADTNTKIPVLYGTAVFGGNLIDVRMTADNKVMHFVYVLSECTGNLMSTGAASAYTIEDIYWDDKVILFKEGGQIVASTADREGNIDNSLDGLVEIYCYTNGSTGGALPEGYSGTVPPAYNVVPGWTDAWQMSDLIFAVVKVTYSQEKGVTGIGQLAFKITNSMVLPGDVLYDQMTNTRYGAGIDPTDIREA